VSGAAERESPLVPLALVRPALVAAWAVARSGPQARPPIAVPGRLRPLLRYAKLPDRALLTIRQVVEDEAEFRERVATLTNEAELGRAAWLWLSRPAGWATELEDLAGAAEAATNDAEEQRLARTAKRQLQSAEAELARLRGELAVLRQAGEALGKQAEEDRRARRKAESERDRIQTALQTVNAERAGLQAALSELRDEVATRTEEATRIGERSAALADDLDRARAEARDVEGRFAAARRDAEQATASNQDLRAAVADALSKAAAAAAELGGAIGSAAQTLAGAGGPYGTGEPGPAATEQAERTTPSEPEPAPAVRSGRVTAKRRPRLPSQPRRTPLPLPPAVLDDSAGAAAHLVRAPGVMLIVDGYNITLTSWPDLDLAGQRRRLLDALAELTARTGAAVRVVFDGTDEGGAIKPPRSASGRMRVEFTARDVEADQVIIEMLDQLGEDRPVVVASDDGWVRAEAASRGANLISVAQLLAAVGRRRAPGVAD
jgi:predicted RNA-binding protein with PIN domain